MSDATALELGLSIPDREKKVQSKAPRPHSAEPDGPARERYERSLIRSYQDLILRRVNNGSSVQLARTTGDDASYTTEWYRVYDQTSRELWERFIRLYPDIAARYAAEYPALAKAQGEKTSRRGFLKTEGAVLLAGTAAAVATGAIKGEKTVSHLVENKLHADSNITFEPMIHVPYYEDMTTEIAKGNLNFHLDQPSMETTERLRKSNASVLAIDSLYVDPSKDAGSTYLSLDQQKLIWGMTPGRPEVLQPQTKTVYLVAGDMNMYTLSSDYVRYQSQAIENYSDKLGSLDKKDSKRYTTLQAEAMDKTNKNWQETVRTATLIGFLTQQAAGAWLDRKSHQQGTNADTQKLEELLDRVVNRRQVLRGLAGLGLGMFAASKGQQYIDSAVYKVPFATNKLSKDFYQVLTSAIGQNLEPDVWLDGRTAMMIAKEKTAMEYLQEHDEIPATAKGAVVMGNAHDFQGGIRFLGDDEARAEAIAAYAKRISDVTRDVLQKKGLSENFITFAVDNVLDYFSLTGIMKVTDPGIKMIQSADDYISENVQCLATMRSSEIDAILQSLRPPHQQ